MTETIIAIATGSLRPGFGIAKNNDFSLINDNDKFSLPNVDTSGQPIQVSGDGAEEYTCWRFDFKYNANLMSFMEMPSPLQLVVLTLVLSVSGAQIDTDAVKIDLNQFRSIETPAVQGLPKNRLAKVEIDLLDFPAAGYTSAAILKAVAENNSTLPMEYQDDAVIAIAILELVKQIS